MPAPYNEQGLREQIIGLGENSIKKSYYAQLQERSIELERFRTLLDRSSEMIILVEAQSHKVVDINATASVFYGKTKEILLALSLEEWFSKEVVDRLFSYCDDVKNDACKQCSQKAFKMCTMTEMTVQTPKGEIPVEFSVQRATFGEVEYFVLLGTDITERKKAQSQIHALAFYDALTHLPNRQLLLDRLSQSLSNSQRNGQYGAILFLDLDNFKALNDTKGHLVGDELLVQISKRIGSILRDGDTLARLGGDEFVLVLEELDADQERAAVLAEQFAYRVKHVINQPYTLFGYEHTISPSIGVVMFLGNVKSKESLLKHADIAMYQAKQSGRNTICYYDPLMQRAIQDKLLLEKELKIAIEQHQFIIFYQPQVGDEGQLLGLEALVRWSHPKRGLVPPLEFIPLCEETGLIVRIGQWVFEEVCHQIKTWEKYYNRSLHVSVNVSPRQFQEPLFYPMVRDILALNDVNPSLIQLELTESLIVENVEKTIEKMNNLRSLGLKISLDDFGTGYSSLSYLKRLPLDELKIDQSFVKDIGVEGNDAMIVKTIIDMASNFKLNVVAEGVETKEQLDFLKTHGCSIFQGYFFAKPMPSSEIERLYF